jgi:mRNA-degrading endonuclease RelE of RelBE toxin-antitoxin system
MSYRVILTPVAKADIQALPQHLRTVIVERLVQLGDSPASLSRPTVFPYPSGYQLFEFNEDRGEEFWHHFAVLFRYGQDETTLHILGVGHSEFQRDE